MSHPLCRSTSAAMERRSLARGKAGAPPAGRDVSSAGKPAGKPAGPLAHGFSIWLMGPSLSPAAVPGMPGQPIPGQAAPGQPGALPPEVAAAAAPQKIHSNRYLLLADTTIPPSATSKEAQEDVFQFLVRAENAGVLRDTHISSPQMLELLEELERAAQAAIAQRQLLLVVDNEAEEDVVVPVVAHVVKIASYF